MGLKGFFKGLSNFGEGLLNGVARARQQQLEYGKEFFGNERRTKQVNASHTYVRGHDRRLESDEEFAQRTEPVDNPSKKNLGLTEVRGHLRRNRKFYSY